ncbi:MAG: HAAS domain-containing protein [Bacillota bacterium]
MEQHQLSDKSQRFIDDLRLYLFSSGKNESEIKEIAEELEVHLFEAELHGKSIERIVGASPKEYMMNISNEMKTDYRAWVRYTPLIIIGTMSFSIFGDLLQGTLSYSVLKIIGTILYSLMFLGGVMITFRYVARKQVTRIKEFIILLIPIIISMLFFGGLIILDSIYNTPIIDFGLVGSLAIGLIFLCFVILFSIWVKSAVLPVILIALHLPTFMLSFTSFEEEVQLITGMVITYLLIGLYLFYVLRKMKREA